MSQGGALDRTYDVVVVGSGAGGMSSALTAKLLGLEVLVVEKEALFGGTTARSGGVLWVPNNPVNARVGVKDSVEAARTYLKHETGNFYDEQRVGAFLENGPAMVEFFESQTAVKFAPNPAFPDYHPNAPGAVPGGRSIVAAPMSGLELGDRFKELRPPLREITFVGMMFNASAEVQHFFKATKSLKSFVYVVRRLAAHGLEVVKHGRATRLTNGNALAARLAKSLFDLNVPLVLSTAAVELQTNDDGAVTGIVLRHDGKERTIGVRRGVVLAAGGFPQDLDRRKKLFPHAPHGTEHYSPAPPGNTGDGIRLGQQLGGQPEDGLPNAAAWIPVSRVPHSDGSIGHFPHLIDRYKPGIIAVNKAGRRFANEANSYHDFGRAMIEASRGQEETAAWLICDQKTLNAYGMGFVKPFPVPHFMHIDSGYLLRGRTVAELAGRAGIDAVGLETTIADFNGPARSGEDPAFGRGSTAYNRFLGDANHKPNPCVAPVEQGPFYAIKMLVGDLGTFAGLRTDSSARVLNDEGTPIPGLYAAGNDMASIMGGNYPGGGITLGPAMTFGYIAGQHLSRIPPVPAPERT